MKKSLIIAALPAAILLGMSAAMASGGSAPDPTQAAAPSAPAQNAAAPSNAMQPNAAQPVGAAGNFTIKQIPAKQKATASSNFVVRTIDYNDKKVSGAFSFSLPVNISYCPPANSGLPTVSINLNVCKVWKDNEFDGDKDVDMLDVNSIGATLCNFITSQAGGFPNVERNLLGIPNAIPASWAAPFDPTMVTFVAPAPLAYQTLDGKKGSYPLMGGAPNPPPQQAAQAAIYATAAESYRKSRMIVVGVYTCKAGGADFSSSTATLQQWIAF